MATKKKTVAEVKKAVTEKNSQPAAVQKAAEIETVAAVNIAAGLTDEKVATAVAKLQIEINRSLSEISPKIQQKISELQAIEHAKKVAEDELEALYDKTIVAESIDAMLTQLDDLEKSYQSKSKELAALYKQSEDTLKEEYQKTRTNLEQARAREIDEYDFKKKVSRRDEEQRYADELARKKREQDLAEEMLKRSWTEKSQQLEARELQIKAKEDKLNNFDALVKAEVDKAVIVAVKAAQSELYAKFGGEKKDLEHKINILVMEKSNVEKLLDAAKSDIESSRANITSLQGKVESLAKAALEASSGREALAAVQQNTQQSIKK